MLPYFLLSHYINTSPISEGRGEGVRRRAWSPPAHHVKMGTTVTAMIGGIQSLLNRTDRMYTLKYHEAMLLRQI